VIGFGNRLSAGLPPRFILICSAVIPQLWLNVALSTVLQNRKFPTSSNVDLQNLQLCRVTLSTALLWSVATCRPARMAKIALLMANIKPVYG
jgi:hypothetical protein